MIEFRKKNYFWSQIFGTLFYVSFVTLAILLILEFAKRGFVSYHFNLMWLVILLIISGALYAVFRASTKPVGLFSYVMYGLALVLIFLVLAGQVDIDIIGKYILSIIIVLIFGAAVWVIKPPKK